MQAIREEISMIFLTDFFNAAGILPYHIRCNAPNEKYIVFFVFRNRAPLLAKLAVCNVVFPDFCSIDRSPVLTHHHLLLITAGHQRCPFVKEGCQKSGKTTADISDKCSEIGRASCRERV